MLEILTGGLNILLPVLAAVIGIVGLFFKVKYDGKKEARNEIAISTLREGYQSVSQRLETDESVNNLSDDELNRLRSRYERD